jgi:hypothetical protein
MALVALGKTFVVMGTLDSLPLRFAREATPLAKAAVLGALYLKASVGQPLNPFEEALGAAVGLHDAATLAAVKPELAELERLAETDDGARLVASFVFTDLSILFNKHDILDSMLENFRAGLFAGLDQPGADEMRAAAEIVHRMSLKLPRESPFTEPLAP